jgi:methyl-accepting chemotaxis protein
VVAGQVRRLSEDAKVATRDIDKLIERVQDAVREAITAMDAGPRRPGR